MGDFHRDSFSDRLKSPYAGWYVTVYGKGGVTETIVANELVIRELEAYRIANDLYPPLPHPDDETEMERPAILSVNSAHRRNGAISDQMIYMICKEIFSRASEIAESHSDRQAAQRLARATPHWFRHTGVTWALDAGASPRAVMAQARHASINTTMRYDHPDMRQMTDILSSMLSCIRGH
jgi:integrase